MLSIVTLSKTFNVVVSKDSVLISSLAKMLFVVNKFLTNKSVLIPRPDTELIIEEALNYLSIDKSKKIMDVAYVVLTRFHCLQYKLLLALPPDAKRQKNIMCVNDFCEKL